MTHVTRLEIMEMDDLDSAKCQKSRIRNIRLLSKFPANPTVEILQAKKESCSTRRGLRVDSGFREFCQTPRGRGFTLLGFYTLFKCFIMFRLA